jgi:hypothetical protein
MLPLGGAHGARGEQRHTRVVRRGRSLRVTRQESVGPASWLAPAGRPERSGLGQMRHPLTRTSHFLKRNPGLQVEHMASTCRRDSLVFADAPQAACGKTAGRAGPSVLVVCSHGSWVLGPWLSE